MLSVSSNNPDEKQPIKKSYRLLCASNIYSEEGKRLDKLKQIEGHEAITVKDVKQLTIDLRKLKN